VLRRLPGKAPKRRNIEIFLRFGNTARQDASTHENVTLFLREPLFPHHVHFQKFLGQVIVINGTETRPAVKDHRLARYCALGDGGIVPNDSTQNKGPIAFIIF
jgi:hypothetical protein